MNFEDFLGTWKAKKANRDENLARSLLKNTRLDMKFLDKLEVDEISARKLVSNYYDVLRSILEAIAALDGYKIYGHEVFTAYLKEKGENTVATKFDRFRKIRNKINYYGEDINLEQAKEIIEDIKKIINSLIDKYLKGTQ